MFNFLKNTFVNYNRYKTHDEAVIVACFFNPQNNPYRLIAFQKWYKSIKHMNHRIIECLIGPDAKSQLPKSQYISSVNTESLLFHKETLLNKVIKELPAKFKYVFWLDTDVLFTNSRWLLDGVKEMQQGTNLIQPFEYCIHLERNKLKPNFDVELNRHFAGDPESRHKHMWRSFCSNYASGLAGNYNYDKHGHVGFAWGAKREVLDTCPLFDRALVGGADHIMAHAAAGHIGHSCITKSFTENLKEIEEWSNKFFNAVKGRIGYVKGDLYHIWHGDIEKRQYLKRIKDFTGNINDIKERDAAGLHVARKNAYVKKYYREREVREICHDDFDEFYFDPEFIEDMGYSILNAIEMFSQPSYNEEPIDVLDIYYKNDLTPYENDPSIVIVQSSSDIILEQQEPDAIIDPGRAELEPQSENFS
jgi:hypothetical protein